MAGDNRRIVPAAAAVGVAVAFAAGWWWTREPSPPAREGAGAPPVAEPLETSAPAREPAAPAPAARTLAVGDTLALSRDELPPSGPLVLTLQLGEPAANAEPRPVKVFSLQDDDRSLELSAAVDDTRSAARLELDPSFLTPGRYLVQVRTTERSHFPHRRYMLEVR